ncbi:Suppressor of the cold-sensitive snRNP bioproteinsis mutant brr1-1, partial [Perkinsus olseni]
SASVSSFVDVRSVPGMVADRVGARRLSSTEEAVVDCLSNELAVDSMFTVGVQVINTASVDCEATREELCEYLADACENLGLEVICEPNFAVELNGGLVEEAVRALPLAELNVNDEHSERQWNLELIGMNEAWEALEDRSLREVVVAVVDTGVDYRHKDHGHGTSCAGILGAVTNDGVGIAGIAPVKIMAVRAFDSDGNDGSDISVNKRYPCAYTEDAEMLCVASSNSLDQLASHSNYAPFVDLAAPGERVFVTERNNGYTSKSGTSMAGPQ